MSRRSVTHQPQPKADQETGVAHTSLSPSALASIGAFPVLQVFVQTIKGSSRPQLVIQSADIPEGEGEAIIRTLLAVLPQAIASAASSTGVSVKGTVQKSKKPPNSFMMFSNKMRPQILAQNRNLSNAEVSKILGSRWKSLSPEEKQVYVSAADRIRNSRKNDEAAEPSEAIQKKRKKESEEAVAEEPGPEKAKLAYCDQMSVIPLPAIPIPLTTAVPAPPALSTPCVHLELCPAPCASATSTEGIFGSGEFDFDDLDDLLSLPGDTF